MIKALNDSKHFQAPVSIYKIADYAKDIVSIGNQTGEGKKYVSGRTCFFGRIEQVPDFQG